MAGPSMTLFTSSFAPTSIDTQMCIRDSRWTVFEAIDLNVSAPIITESLMRRIRSREENNFTDRMLAIMRNEFGGHEVKTVASEHP